LVPADGEEVHDAAAETVPEAIFGDAGDAGAVVDGNLDDARAGGMREHGHETMKTVEREQGVEHGAFEGAQAAAGVVEIHAEHRGAGAAGDFGGDAAEPIVLALGPHAADDVVFFQLGEEAGKIGGIVLEVAVEGDDDGGAGVAEAGPEGGALAGVAAVAEAADAGIGAAGGDDFLPGGVGAGVVHENEFEGAAFTAQGGEDLGNERGDVVSLVEHRDDDGDFRLHDGSTRWLEVWPWAWRKARAREGEEWERGRGRRRSWINIMIRITKVGIPSPCPSPRRAGRGRRFGGLEPLGEATRCYSGRRVFRWTPNEDAVEFWIVRGGGGISLESMSHSVVLEKYSFGIGDRFAHQAKAQLRAVMLAAAQGAEVTPVWNKSNREHGIVGSRPVSVRTAAERAVKELGWTKPWHVDADHIRLETVDAYIESSDFFTMDVADSIGHPAREDMIQAFMGRHPELAGRREIPGIARPLEMSREEVSSTAGKYLSAVAEAGRIYRHIGRAKGPGRFITEISMDETDSPQTPAELLLILAGMADEGIPLQTIAPKFTGRFNKGVDYAGDVGQFEREFADDLAVIAFAVMEYGLPKNLKLSVHSGSDKFSIYEPIRRGLAKFGAGVHLKTAGTTWLSELIGLAEAGGGGLALAKEIYGEALEHRAELCEPYATVIDIDPAKLPERSTVAGWSSEQFTAALRHDPKCGEFNPHLRQLLHVAFKIAAKQGERYTKMLDECEAVVSRNVTQNLYERHLKPLFLDGETAAAWRAEAPA
jgi:tagaturonate epimerase